MRGTICTGIISHLQANGKMLPEKLHEDVAKQCGTTKQAVHFWRKELTRIGVLRQDTAGNIYVI